MSTSEVEGNDQEESKPEEATETSEESGNGESTEEQSEPESE